MKKSVKIGLIIWASLLVAAGVRAGLTKLGVFPNWFDIEILCPRKRVDYKISDLDWKDSDCDGFGCAHTGMMVRKPIIYLYPTTETKVHVHLGHPEILSHTYPKYNSKEGRNVIAQPNGDLEDIETGRGLYALYREGITNNKPELTEGFIVKGEDTIAFLEEKLAILGLNEREAEEFIVYRLPQMEGNAYNLIRFETLAEQNEAMPLNITPTPDTVIRIMMDWKVLDEYVEIPEQELLTPERTEFVVVERGGSKLD